VQPHLALRRGGQGELANAQLGHATVLANAFEQQVWRALGHPQRLGHQRGHRGIGHLQQQRHTPHHAVTIGHKAQGAVAPGRLLQGRQCGQRGGKVVQPAGLHGVGINPVEFLQGRCRRACGRILQQRKAQHRRCLLQAAGKHRVVVGQG
jgi:hypothetical protein